MSQRFEVQLLSPDEYEDRVLSDPRYINAYDSLGFADPQSGRAFVRDTHWRQLNAYLINHEFDHLLNPENGSDKDESGIYHKKIFRDVISPIHRVTLPILGGIIGGPTGAAIGGAIGESQYQAAQARHRPDVNATSAGVRGAAKGGLTAGGIATGNPALGAAGAASGQAIFQAGSATPGAGSSANIVKAGASGGAAAAIPAIFQSFRGARAGTTATPQAAAPSGTAASAPSGVSGRLAGGGLQKFNVFNQAGALSPESLEAIKSGQQVLQPATLQPSPGGGLSANFPQNIGSTFEPTSAALSAIQAFRAAQPPAAGGGGQPPPVVGQPQPQAQPGQPTSTGLQSVTNALTGGGSVLAALGISQQAAQQAAQTAIGAGIAGAPFAGVGPQPPRAGDIPDLATLPGVQAFGQDVRGRLTDLTGRAQKLTDLQLPPDIQSSVDREFQRFEEDITKQFKLFRPGADLATDTGYRDAILQVRQVRAEANARARREFIGVARNNLLAELDINQQMLPYLAELAALDIETLAARTQLTREEANQFREIMGLLGVAVATGGASPLSQFGTQGTTGQQTP